MEPEKYRHIVYALSQSLLYRIIGSMASLSFSVNKEKELVIRIITFDEQDKSELFSQEGFVSALKRYLPEMSAIVEMKTVSRPDFDSLNFDILEYPVFLRKV